jgi:hypothetical protein
MKLTLHDGDVIEIPFEGAAAGGYRAKSMEFAADDLTTMRRLLVANPEHLLAILRQLEGRLRRVDQLFPGDGEPFDLAQPRNALETLLDQRRRDALEHYARPRSEIIRTFHCHYVFNDCPHPQLCTDRCRLGEG